jgi:hypothetical protein
MFQRATHMLSLLSWLLRNEWDPALISTRYDENLLPISLKRKLAMHSLKHDWRISETR